MNIPANLKYTSDHEWINIEGNVGTIGITDYAQGELGDVVFVDITSDLSEVIKGESFGTIEAVKTVSDLFGPCNGKVVEINAKLENEPQLVNTDPYGDGWLIKIEISNESEITELLDAETYKNSLG